MATNYPGRPPDMNMDTNVHARILGSQARRLDKAVNYFGMKRSEIVREALTLWLNINPVKNEEG